MRPFRWLTFRTRLTLRWTLVFGALLAAANFSIYVAVRSSAYGDLDRHVRTLAGTEVASSTDGPIGVHVHELPIPALAGGTFIQKVVQIYDGEGQLVLASEFDNRLTPFIDGEMVEAGLAGRAPVASVTVNGRPARAIVLRATRDGQTYAIAVGLFIDGLVSGLARLAWLLALVWIAGIAATAAVGFALASTALRPVRRITQRAAAIADGDFSARLDPPQVNDEIGDMTRSLNRLLERLHAAIEANRRFASDAAHELQSPITAMAGEIDVTLRRDRTEAEYRETLARVRERLVSLSTVASDLMVLVRAQEAGDAVDRQEVPLGPLLQRAIARVRPLADARRVTIGAASLPPFVTYAEAGLLGRVFDNVLENAVRYNRDGGRVDLTGHFDDGDAEAWTPGTIVVHVADTGPGIMESERTRIFERFYRLDRSRARHTGGTGLGLAISREVLMLFGGTIAVHASSPEGTVMEIRLPGIVQQAASEQEPRAQLNLA